MTVSTKPATPAGAPAATWARWIRPAAFAVGVAVALSVLLWAAQRTIIWWMADWNVYYMSSEVVLRGGGDLYDVVAPPLGPDLQFNAPFNYPPFAALLLTPFSLLGVDALSLVWNTLKMLALGGVVWVSLGAVAVPRGRRRLVLTAVVVTLVQFLDPVLQDVQVGNINVFILLAFLDLMRPQGARGKGVLVGLAAGVKITPGIFIVYLLLTRQFRAAATATVTFLGTVAVAFAVLPADSLRYWSSAMWEPDRVFIPEFTYNQSLRGVVVRLLGNDDNNLLWLALAAVTFVAALAIGAGLHRRGMNFEGVLVVAIAMLLISPFSWIAHWVWIVPVLVLLWTMARRTRSRWLWALTVFVLLVFLLRPYMFASFNPLQGYGLSPGAQLLAATFVITGVLLVALAEVYRRRGPLPRLTAQGRDAGGRDDLR
ncbi:glycosyltransferase 87 family protein [Nonomuraea sp. NPDC050783]|uniref:glycosyltransferase 87 family protein n=1 Tax=Nonomuraea sp. NPDC050783 TaxID=3154634 RepID=UPI00346570BD